MNHPVSSEGEERKRGICRLLCFQAPHHHPGSESASYAQAEDYASVAGLTVDGPVTISSGSVNWYSNRIQPVALAAGADYMAESSKASASYYAGDLEVSASVSVTFNLI